MWSWLQCDTVFDKHYSVAPATTKKLASIITAQSGPWPNLSHIICEACLSLLPRGSHCFSCGKNLHSHGRDWTSNLSGIRHHSGYSFLWVKQLLKWAHIESVIEIQRSITSILEKVSFEAFHKRKMEKALNSWCSCLRAVLRRGSYWS